MAFCTFYVIRARFLDLFMASSLVIISGLLYFLLTVDLILFSGAFGMFSMRMVLLTKNSDRKERVQGLIDNVSVSYNGLKFCLHFIYTESTTSLFKVRCDTLFQNNRVPYHG